MVHASGDNQKKICPVFGSQEASADGARDFAELAALDAKVNALLPPRYQYCFDSVNPRSMGSAGLKYGPDSRVAWDQIWTHFCDLALAGGPPHRGSLLEAPTPEEVEAEPAGYQLVRDEIVRGVRMTSGLSATTGPELGWITVVCHSREMAEWLLRAVMAENVFVRRREETIQLPAGPTFRLAKEVKNVVVALAKTCHYWQDHLSAEQRSAAGSLFANPQMPALLEPPSRHEVLAHAESYRGMADQLGRELAHALGLQAVSSRSQGWVGLECRDERMAAWFVRSAIAMNILARREEHVLFLPVPPPPSDRHLGFPIMERVIRLYRLWSIRDSEVVS